MKKENTEVKDIPVIEYMPGKFAGKKELEKRALEKTWAMADVYLTHHSQKSKDQTDK